MDLKIEPFPGFLNVSVSGKFSVEKAVAGFSQILESCQDSGQTSVLIDFSQLTDADSATLRVMFAASARELYEHHLSAGGQPLRVAFFGRFLTWQPGMEVASQNGPGVRTFTNIDEARGWLGV